jgi:hypothetical protein
MKSRPPQRWESIEAEGQSDSTFFLYQSSRLQGNSEASIQIRQFAPISLARSEFGTYSGFHLAGELHYDFLRCSCAGYGAFVI